MTITKRVDGKNISLKMKKIKSYPKYDLYSVYNEKGEKLYNRCYSKADIESIKAKNNLIISWGVSHKVC